MATNVVGTMCKMKVGQTVCALRAASPDSHSFRSQAQLGNLCNLAPGHAEILHSPSGGWKTVQTRHNHHISDIFYSGVQN
jgi:hypothetical protein